MLFNSIDYLIFFPIVILIYFVIPRKAKNGWLLVSSYYFYMNWNAKYLLLIVSATIVTFLCGIFLDSISVQTASRLPKKIIKKMIISTGLFLTLGMLFYFKYTNFFFNVLLQISNILQLNFKLTEFDIVLPVGISFFTFQAIGYIIDVYRKEIPAEKNFIRYALFVSFFPQLVAGPIERSKNLLNQFKGTNSFDADHARAGLLTMGYGLFLKIVVADNISLVIDPLFSEPEQYAGMELLMASILFAFQIYCDFEGYTQLAIGSARILGYRLNENFNAPYLASSVKDFWRRWHISLTSWFRDYLYIPLGGSRKGHLRKQINTMIIFLCSGLWHGAAWHFVFWGGLNGFFSIIEDILMPFKQKVFTWLKISENQLGYKIFQRIVTFLLIDVTWIFFRVSLRSGFLILKKIFEDFRLEWFLNIEYSVLFDTPRVMMIIIFSLVIILFVDILRYTGRNAITLILKQQLLFRWIIYWLIFLFVIYWGIYGEGYEQTQFIYFQF